MYDIFGKQILCGNIVANNSMINLENYPSGVYYITDEKGNSYKIVKL